MRIFPAVDVLEGRCVQLVQGQREKATFYGDPHTCAWRWIREGADALHLINLDGAFGASGKNVALIRRLIEETGVMTELGGGIRTREDAISWLETGVDRIILGTLAIRDPPLLGLLATEYGSERIMASVDARGGQVVIEGWREPSGEYLRWAKEFEAQGAGALLFTNVDIEGLQQGIQPEPIKALLQEIDIPVVIAGGVSSTADVRLLRTLGASGVVLGSALYSGKITLHEAMEAAA
ncbi:MAG: 1-(5-phosphoribosyl)-5-[(5-phosphoribosylamino)methylideneamino]imidazole-4-carboxamide isomerase [Methanomicrobiales archaeon]|nr:1-(5-phosphoribosyl)-5-[(5-phosphoribosylamino)methylideneamino]imidazole-4-carboxamide isomerase [Methanomicrobiales archaeon]